MNDASAMAFDIQQQKATSLSVITTETLLDVFTLQYKRSGQQEFE